MGEFDAIFAKENRVDYVAPQGDTAAAEKAAADKIASDKAAADKIATDNATAEANKTIPDYKPFLKETFGTEDVEAIKTRYTGYESISEKAARLEKENGELQAKTAPLPYKSDFARKADELFEKTGGNVKSKIERKFYAFNMAS